MLANYSGANGFSIDAATHFPGNPPVDATTNDPFPFPDLGDVNNDSGWTSS